MAGKKQLFYCNMLGTAIRGALVNFVDQKKSYWEMIGGKQSCRREHLLDV